MRIVGEEPGGEDRAGVKLVGDEPGGEDRAGVKLVGKTGLG